MTDDLEYLKKNLKRSSEIAVLCGVNRSTVSNWAKRYRDFPEPYGGSYLWPEVEEFLVSHNLPGWKHGKEADMKAARTVTADRHNADGKAVEQVSLTVTRDGTEVTIRAKGSGPAKVYSMPLDSWRKLNLATLSETYTPAPGAFESYGHYNKQKDE